MFWPSFDERCAVSRHALNQNRFGSGRDRPCMQYSFGSGQASPPSIPGGGTYRQNLTLFHHVPRAVVKAAKSTTRAPGWRASSPSASSSRPLGPHHEWPSRIHARKTPLREAVIRLRMAKRPEGDRFDDALRFSGSGAILCRPASLGRSLASC